MPSLCFSPGGGAVFSHRMHGTHRKFSWCSGLRCTNRDSIAIFPQVSWEFGCVSPPTDFTDLHRCFVALIRPRNSQNSQKFCCVGHPTEFTDLHRWLGCVNSPTEFTEFTEVLLRWFSHRIHGIHRSFIASHSSINLESVLWEMLLCQNVPCVLWAISLFVLLVQFLL